MINVGITGQVGFIGTHLYNVLSLEPDLFNLIPFEDEFFKDLNKLGEWVSKCDTIVHLAALNRHNDPDEIYQTNLRLVRILISVLDETGSKPHVLFSSSTLEEFDSPYGRSKREGRELLIEWSLRSGAPFSGLVIPNVFGPFGDPYYNSVVATFSYQLANSEPTRIDVDKSMKLIYVGELSREFRDCILLRKSNHNFKVPYTSA